MQMFTKDELKLIGKLQTQPPLTVLQIRKPCPSHSVCNPLPLFRIYKVDESSFEAQWNGYHDEGVKQTFQFSQTGNS
jgi:hypothetical protein